MQRIGSTARRLGMDGVLLAGCFLAAFLIRFEGHVPATYRGDLPWTLAIAVTAMLLGMVHGRAYRKVSALVSLGDFVGVLRGTVLAACLLLVLNALVPTAFHLPWSVVTIYALLSMVVMTLALFQRRLRDETPLGRTSLPATVVRRPVLVYGAGRAGDLVARDIRSSPELGYDLAGFLDDDPGKWGKELQGTRVLGGRHDLPRLLGPELREVILAIPSLDAEVRRELLSHCRRAGAQVRIVPGLAELLRSGSVAQQIRDVRVEDLLPREAVELDETPVRALLEGATVLVTGAAGSIGSELCHQILRHEPGQLLLVEQSESRLYYLEMELTRKLRPGRTQLVPIVADIYDRPRIESIFKTYRPAHVFHAAAYKHVPMMERNPQEAIRNNVLATHSLATLAGEYRAQRFTLVSTDKAVEPSCVMGASKRCAELVVRQLQYGSRTRYVTVRFGNVLDSDGSVVPLFKKQIAEGGPLTITHPEMERFFMTIPEAARLILQATSMGEGGEVFVLEMGKPVRILDLARSLVELSGLRFMEDIQVEFSGMRPGEKLSEKLFFDHESSVATENRMIHRARLENGHQIDLEELLGKLELMLHSAADAETVARQFMGLVRGLDAPHATVEAEPVASGSRPRVIPLARAAASTR